jgi:hypothetical protein
MTNQVLPIKTEKLLTKLKSTVGLSGFYLAGGTGLALHYNHRQSVDLDWFTPKSFKTKLLIKKLQKIGDFELINEDENTVEGILDGVKVSFMSYPYALLKKIAVVNGVRVASVSDIAVMKLSAIAGRNTKKDFIDLYFYLQKEKTDLFGLLQLLKKKFGGLRYDIHHLVKTLVFFTDADKEPMPTMSANVNWNEVKNFFVKEVRTPPF